MVNEALTGAGAARLLLRDDALFRTLARFPARLLDLLRQATGEPARSDRRAAVRSGRSDILHRARLVGPGGLLLASAAGAILLRQAIALGFGAARADDDLVVGRARARIVAVNDDFADAVRGLR